MLRRFLNSLLLVLFCFFPVVGTNRDTALAQPFSVRAEVTDLKTYLPLVMNGLETILSPQTIVLQPAALDSLSKITSDGLFVFDSGAPGLEDISTGKIIVGNTSAACPEGFLRKVVSVINQAGSIYVQTEPATLEDAIQQSAIQFNRPLTVSDVESMSLAPGVTLLNNQGAVSSTRNAEVTATAPLNFEINDVVLYDNDGDKNTTNDQLRVDGSLQLSPDLDFTMLIKDNHLDQMTFTVNLMETTDLKFNTQTELASLHASYRLGNLRIAAFTVMEGPIPLVFTVEMPIYLKADGSVSIGVTAGATQTSVLKAGLHYQNGLWMPVQEFSNQFSYTPPRLTAAMGLKGYISAPLTLKLYGVEGPYGEISPYLKLEVETEGDPWWTLKGGLDVNIGFNLGIFGGAKDDHSYHLIEYEKVLSEPPSRPSPPAAEEQASSLPTLSWTLNAIDQGNLVYDVYLEAGNPQPSIKIVESQTDTIISPGQLEKNTTYYWQVIAINPFGLEMSGPVWSFTTDDGTIIPGQMVYIPAGAFQMGCNPSRPGGYGCPEDELPLHSVYLDAYYIDKYEVTNGQYRQCVTAGACVLHQNNTMNHKNYATDPAFSNYPVIAVNWSDAQAYCTWVEKRLPTEAEWEKAARGPAANVFPWGDQTPDCTYSNLKIRNENGYPYCVEDTMPIGSYSKDVSGYGVVDMAGNVAEMVSDWYKPDYYAYSPLVNPQGPENTGYLNRVTRGGSWAISSGCARNSDRGCIPNITEWGSVGFRCAVSTEP